MGDDSTLPSCLDGAGHSLTIGDAVRLHLPSSHGGDAPTRKDALSWVRWIGRPSFAEGVWCGLQLQHSTGKHDGIVKGTRYFSCPAKCGVFVRPKYLAFDAKAPMDPQRPVHAAPEATQAVHGAPVQRREAAAPAAADTPSGADIAAADASLDDVLAECRAHMDNMLSVLKAEFTTASALAEPAHASGDAASDVSAAVRIMLGAVQERLALDKMWYVRLLALQKGTGPKES